MASHRSDLDVLLESYRGEAFAAQPGCPICAGTSVVVDKAVAIHPEHPVPLELRQCRSCRHVWVDPMPQQPFLSYLYGEGSHSVIGVGWESSLGGEMSIPERRTLAAEEAAQPGRYLELGLGKGLLYRTFLERSWACSGIEPGSWGRHLPGVVSSIEALPLEPINDVLVAIDVLEHLTDPLEMTTKLRRLAAPGARLYAAFPNTQSFRFRLQKGGWRMVRPLGHVHYFSRTSLNTMFNAAGFQVLRTSTNDMALPVNLRRPRTLVSASIQAAGLGDQWFVTAVSDDG